MEELKDVFKAGWETLNTPLTLPWIGQTSPLLMFIFLAVLGFIVDFVNRAWGNDDD